MLPLLQNSSSLRHEAWRHVAPPSLPSLGAAALKERSLWLFPSRVLCCDWTTQLLPELHGPTLSALHRPGRSSQSATSPLTRQDSRTEENTLWNRTPHLEVPPHTSSSQSSHSPPPYAPLFLPRQRGPGCRRGSWEAAISSSKCQDQRPLGLRGKKTRLCESVRRADGETRGAWVPSW